MNRKFNRQRGTADPITLALLLCASVVFIFKGPGILDSIPFLHKKKPIVPAKSTLLQEHERQAAQFIHDYVVMIEQIEIEESVLSRRHKSIAKELAYRVVIAVGGAPIQKIDVTDLDAAEKLKGRLEKEQANFNEEVQKWVREVKKLEAEKNALGKAIDGLWNWFLYAIVICIVLMITMPATFGLMIKRLKNSFVKTVGAFESSCDPKTLEKFRINANSVLDSSEKRVINRMENSIILK